MYQALYRKYRPKTFDDVVGQEVVIQTLKNSILNNKISHAYLLSGPRGCGKTSIAKIFARTINCEHPNGTNPCGQCVCCTQTSEQNLDIIEMDAASNNGVDEIREINNKVNLVPSIGKYKVYIIDEVHMMTIGAFNALLKTLEEPPAHVIFILATTDPNKVPITILSRCQRFDLKKISENNIFDRLTNICKEEKVDITDEALHEMARLGDGSLRDTLGILDQVIAYSQDKITVNIVHEVNGSISQTDISTFVQKVTQNDIIGVLKDIKTYNDSGKNMIKITEEIILYLRNTLLYKEAPLVLDNCDIYKCISEELTIDDIIEYIKVLSDSMLDMKKFSNSKMLLELALIKIMNSKKNFPGNIEAPLNKKNFLENVNSENQIVSKQNKNKNVADNDMVYTRQLVNETSDMSKLNCFIDTRVSNTLSKFSKKQTTDLKKKICNLNDYLMDEKYGNIASIILDGELKAVGDNYLIFAYSTISLTNLFNGQLKKIEELLNLVLESPYNVIAVDNLKWNEIKEKFNSKKVLFTFKQEEYNIDDILKTVETNNDDMQSIFGDIVEYE